MDMPWLKSIIKCSQHGEGSLLPDLADGGSKRLQQARYVLIDRPEAGRVYKDIFTNIRL